jgi:hypothetical protein
LPPQPLFTVESEQAQVMMKDVVRMRLNVRLDPSTIHIGGWSANVLFDPTLLLPDGLDLDSTFSAGAVDAEFEKRPYGGVAWAHYASEAPLPSGQTPLATLEFIALAGSGDTGRAAVTLGSVYMVTTEAFKEPCVDAIALSGQFGGVTIVPPCAVAPFRFDYARHPLLSVSPNPTSARATAEVYSTGEEMRLELLSVLGTVVWNSGALHLPQGIQRIELPADAAASGPLVLDFRSGAVHESRMLLRTE